MQKKFFFTNLPTLFFSGPLQETNNFFLGLTQSALIILSLKAITTARIYSYLVHEGARQIRLYKDQAQ